MDPRLMESSLDEEVEAADEDLCDEEEDETASSTRFLLDLLLRSTLDGLQCFSIVSTHA